MTRKYTTIAGAPPTANTTTAAGTGATTAASTPAARVDLGGASAPHESTSATLNS
jgi:hypothetical protein